MSYDLARADELQQLIANVGEFRLAAHLFIGDAVNTDRIGFDLTLGVDEAMEGPARWQKILDLDATDFDQAMTLAVVDAGGFGVEDDFCGHGP